MYTFFMMVGYSCNDNIDTLYLLTNLKQKKSVERIKYIYN